MLSDDEHVALEVGFDPEGNGLARVNWEYSRRLIRGALLVFARDLSFTSIVLATVSKRDVAQLNEGRLTVELCEPGVGEDLFTGTYVMVECINFYGAYLHPMRALQALDEASVPLREYLVEGSSASVVPHYLMAAALQGSGLKLPAGDAEGAPPALLQDPSLLAEWPSAASLGLDESQHRALQGALTNKVMLVQGPPGTGKTYLGIRVARTLLVNQNLWRCNQDPRPLLVICSTNHALDQFLLGLLPFTNNLVRVGNPCREKALEPYDIYTLRRQKLQGAFALFQMIRTHRERFNKLKGLHERVRSCLSLLRAEGAGILSPETLHAFGIITDEQLQFFDEFPLEIWLLGEAGNTPLLLDQVQETMWRPTDVEPYLDVLDGVDVSALQHTVRLAVSGNMLKKALEDVVADEDALAVRALRHLEHTVGARMTAPDTRPEGMQAGMGWLELETLPEPRRWQAYRSWHEELVTELTAVAEELSLKYSEGAQLVQECRLVQDQTIMSNRMVIGMSVSYAAMRHRIVKQLKPRIVIVEEAAEVLEAGVLVSLGSDVEHLVMIGDHKQLRPKTSVGELATDYHLDVSLFERLVNNGVHCVTLNTQHRMRPEVARLICPNIYPKLLNHESVNYFPSIRGITKDVFFLDHKNLEEEPTFLRDSNSMQNSFEAQFVSALVRYLLLQGYEPSKITVLCTYKAQLYFLTKQLRPADAHLRDVRITTVDEYQGEENDIVVLSIVRFYMVGNMSTLTSRGDSVWRGVREELQTQGAVGSELLLRCDVHATITPVSSARDFEKCPQGGCLKLCGVALSCGHLCPQLCHPLDQEHRQYKCQEPCAEVVCPRGHQCQSRCFELCPPCPVPKKEQLACGHSATMPCHRDPDDHDCQVQVQVQLPDCGHPLVVKCCKRTDPASLVCGVPCPYRRDCGHACDRNCHVLDDPRHEVSVCTRPCEERRAGCCGAHRCRLLCHEECEECDVPVTKALPCDHRLLLACSEPPSAGLCTKRCRRLLPCGHPCRNKCRDACGPCMVQVDKVLPGCGHTRPVACSVDAALVVDCTGPCPRTLSCGHPCTLRCCDPCSDCRCNAPVQYLGRPACGHSIRVPCSSSFARRRRSSDLRGDGDGSQIQDNNDDSPLRQKLLSLLNKVVRWQRGEDSTEEQIGSEEQNDPASFELLLLCEEPCGQELECGHKCAGTCGGCLQGRLHRACQSKCQRVLICGHQCEQPCASSCPPCRKQCSVRCRHSRCSKRCGEPCAPCKERCPSVCVHRQCGSLCGVPCPQGPCNEPCTEVLSCGHPCVGLCGELCLCRPCSDIEIFFGTEEDEDARFVTLPDCKHVFEVSSLDHWLTGIDEKGSEIKKKVCPKCTTVVATSLRYSNAIKQNAEHVAEIKEKLFGTWDTIKPVVIATREILKAMPACPAGLPALSGLVQAVEGALSRVERGLPGPKRRAKRAPTLSLTAVQSLQQYAVVLSELCKLLTTVEPQPLLSAKRTEMENFVEHLCGEFKKRGDFLRISTQEEEVRAVRAALGLAQGHWFHCPNGHPYCITECGGAMEEANCPECGARIGGTNHRLRRDNRLATDIDGATTPAWPPTLQ
ncbi:hypothetical protein FOCC_FOCC003313 [Frankliniella occidentalis]|nr:hypothetical protein FOCC_FOCC003313 [Frankliniella occidentalis]